MMSEQQDNYLSATALAKKYGITAKDMFLYLANNGLIEKRGEVWSLTNEGISAGGKFITGKQFGKYIVWPNDLELDIQIEKLITFPAIEKHFKLAKGAMLDILEQIEWLYRVPNGCRLLPKGQDAGGLEDKDPKTGQLIIKWPKSILFNDELCSMAQSHGGVVETKKAEVDTALLKYTKEECQAKFRTLDGHYVTSEAEVIMDNYLYEKKIAHCYDMRHDGAKFSSTFYLPSFQLFIDIVSSATSKEELEKRRAYYKKTVKEVHELEEKEASMPHHSLEKIIENSNR